MSEKIAILDEDISASHLYNEDLAPVPIDKRSWSIWSLAALWVGMAVCIPTYMLASSFILNGISWVWALVIIGLANIIITVPMVLSGHAGVKYGVPFPVVGRATFGINGVHIPAIIRGLIASVWFGIQTWIGGISIYSIYCAVSETQMASGLSVGHFVGFFIFWLINVYFIYKGTESIKWLETYAAPILIIMGIALIVWGSMKVGSFAAVLENSVQLQSPTSIIKKSGNGKDWLLSITPIKDASGNLKANEYRYTLPSKVTSTWKSFNNKAQAIIPISEIASDIKDDKSSVFVSVRKKNADGSYVISKKIKAVYQKREGGTSDLWSYIIMLTAMVGFWATMSISIADITRYAKSQKDQVRGQFIGLPGTMILFSFVGIFVTIAATLIFPNILIREDAPWDPSTLLSMFDGKAIIIVSQVFMIIATLSTNIAANVIAPANAFANAFPKHINFRLGGIITAVIGIIICPWWIISQIIPFLLFVSSLLGPVVAILICDYYVIRKKNLRLADLFKVDGIYRFGKFGVNPSAMIAFVVGVMLAGIGYFVPALKMFYETAWFTGFISAFVVYYILMSKAISNKTVKI